MHSNKQSGFTLVELAICLIVIGLLIAGVIRAQEMLYNAKLTTTIKQVNSYVGAVATFRDIYGGLPGDIATATKRLPGCNSANYCQDGNSNGYIGDLIWSWYGGQENYDTENTQFWKQMALAHLISGIRPNASVPMWGVSHPVSQFMGGFTIVTARKDPGSYATDPRGGMPMGTVVLRLHRDIADVNWKIGEISPRGASFIDEKMDDGIPYTGNVRGQADKQDPACEEKYDPTVEEFTCTLFFLLNL